MKMNYLPKNKNEYARRHARGPYSRKVLSLIGIFVAAVFFFYIFGSLFIPLVSPLWKVENIIIDTLSKGTDFFSSRQALINENRGLKEKVLSLELELSSTKASTNLQKELLLLLGREEKFFGIFASVLTRPPQSPYDLLIVDIGSNEGIAVGRKVYMPEGAKLGIVSEVFSSQSRVKLLTSPGEKTDAILERHGIPIILEGVGGGNFRTKVPRETEVEIGDKILSADLEGSLVAVVGSVSLESTDAFKKVLAKSPINIFSTRFVVITP